MSADSPQAWYAALPPISKFWFTSCALSTLGFHAKFVDPRAMMLSWRMISLAKGGKFQPWRLLTNFAFLGKLSLGFAMRMVMIAQYSVSLEKEAFTGASGTADYLTFLLFGLCALTPLELVVPSIAQAFYGDSLIFMCLYLWSREHPRARVSLMGIVRVGAFYFPWAMLAMTALMGGDPMPDFLGIIVGHAYYFFARLYPLHSGRRSIIQTPKFVHALADYINSGNGVVSAASNVVQPPRQRYFAGQGRRLGGD
jgi:Derlin-2/3